MKTSSSRPNSRPGSDYPISRFAQFKFAGFCELANQIKQKCVHENVRNTFLIAEMSPQSSGKKVWFFTLPNV